MQYQFLQNSSVDEADIVILPVAFGESVSQRVGCDMAPKAILEASGELEYFDEDMWYSPMKYLNISVLDTIYDYNSISIGVSRLNVSENQLLISLGGDHSITPMLTKPLIGVSKTVLFLDAHADLRESYQGDRFSHATPAYHLLKQGHKIIMVGIRSLFEKEAQIVKDDLNIDLFLSRELRKSSVKERLLALVESLEGEVYLSIDMDVFDPAYVPSVGTPQAGGIDYYLATDILEALFLKSKADVRGVDMVELIPEESGVSQLFAAKLLQKIISYWGVSKGFDKKEPKGAQMRMEYE
jgi:agmatinase